MEVRGQTTTMYCTSMVYRGNRYQISTSLYKLPEAEVPNSQVLDDTKKPWVKQIKVKTKSLQNVEFSICSNVFDLFISR